jgi:hypothetical protein
MPSLQKIEDRFHWLAFPGLFKYLTFMGVIVYVLQWARPDIAEILDFSRSRILAGEVWRVITFIFTPLDLGGIGPMSMLFLFFAVMISFMISDSLEHVWGTTRLSLYIVTLWLCLVISLSFFGLEGAKSGTMLYTSLFLAFAANFPRVEFRLFFFIPVQVRFLAWLTMALLVFEAIFQPSSLAVTIPALIPYAIWVLPGVIRGKARLVEAGRLRTRFEQASYAPAAFHRCEVCGATEQSHPQKEFRMATDGKEYCSEHLPPG